MRNEPKLFEIQERYEAATAGDWFWNSYDAIWVGKGDDSERVMSVSHLEYDNEGDEVPSHGDEIFGPRKAEARANAEFVAHARTDIPLLVETLKNTRKQLHALHGEFRLSAARLGFVANWLENTYNKGGDNHTVRRYADIAKEVLDKGLSWLVEQKRH